MEKYCVVDVGGTAIKFGVIDLDGNLTNLISVATPNNYEDFKKVITKFVLEMKEKEGVLGLAFSSPGAVDSKSGIIGGASALPYIHGPNFKKDFEALTGLKVSIENDANCAALAETCFGSAKDVNDMCFVVVGTGIGGTIVKDKKVHYGKHLYGGEFGFMIMPKEDGSFSTFSNEASTRSFVDKIKEHYHDDSIDGFKAFELASKGDKFAADAIDYFYSRLAMGIFNIQHVFDPELILLGGSISNREDFIDKINEKLDEWIKLFDIKVVRPNIKTCTFKKDANLVGAFVNYKNEYLS